MSVSLWALDYAIDVIIDKDMVSLYSFMLLHLKASGFRTHTVQRHTAQRLLTFSRTVQSFITAVSLLKLKPGKARSFKDVAKQSALRENAILSDSCMRYFRLLPR